MKDKIVFGPEFFSAINSSSKRTMTFSPLLTYGTNQTQILKKRKGKTVWPKHTKKLWLIWEHVRKETKEEKKKLELQAQVLWGNLKGGGRHKPPSPSNNSLTNVPGSVRIYLLADNHVEREPIPASLQRSQPGSIIQANIRIFYSITLLKGSNSKQRLKHSLIVSVRCGYCHFNSLELVGDFYQLFPKAKWDCKRWRRAVINLK